MTSSKILYRTLPRTWCRMMLLCCVRCWLVCFFLC